MRQLSPAALGGPRSPSPPSVSHNDCSDIHPHQELTTDADAAALSDLTYKRPFLLRLP